MSNSSEKTVYENMPLSPDFSSWREEIETFCQQTLAYLQDLMNSAEPLESTEVPTPNAEEGGVVSSRPSPGASSATPGDLDTSQDRLKNLKRELAAKLSNVSKETQ